MSSTTSLHMLQIIADNPIEVNDLCTTFESNISTELEPVTINNIKIYNSKDIGGGGISRQPYFVDSLQKFFPDRKFTNCLEWCSGAGLIGFSLLGAGLCNNLVLADTYLPALDACKKTIAELPLHLQNTSSVRHISRIEQLPFTDKFDLVVGNPPWMSTYIWKLNQSDQRKFVDENFAIHKNFFENIGKYLMPNGIIMLTEGTNFSSPRSFKQMIDSNNLEITKVFKYDDFQWFMIIS